MTIGLLSNLFGSAYKTPSANSGCGCSGNTGGSSGGSKSFGGGLLDLKGGLLGAKSNLINNLLGGIGGGSTGVGQGSSNCGNYGGQGGSSCGGYGGSAGSSSSNGLGSAVGGLASGVHQFAEKAISATGLGGAFAPIDDAIIHPLLWDPISKATGVDVSKHPEGIKDVSNPLGVERK
ncbi:hypothetical protein SAMN05660964_03148 [Thiothrix caldifontis]|jgi:hypothetical protein|uniref:Uncharacterized protein n=1 Tax=Thiothrix caldifontis TaxID=525918 RepID=A0A1H4FXY6_9GAMM|nr:hypothetical protein [Thiothrix caldifontis]SEB01508.1 hypothetical protein SAMN05660964_03148 [Thiothrix caldifontis]